MTTQEIRRSSRIARRAVKQGARPAIPAQVAVEKSTTEPTSTSIKSNKNSNSRLLKCKQPIMISSLNVRSLSSATQMGELVAAAEEHRHEIICLQEHRKYHEDIPVNYHDAGKKWTLVTASAWKNSTNTTIGGVGMLLSPKAMDALSNIEAVTNRILIATFNGNPASSVICCYSPTNVSEEDVAQKFYDDLSSLTRQIPKHNVLVIGGDFNAKVGNSDEYKFSFHETSNRNGKMLTEYLKENKLTCLNTRFQKKNGKRWTHTYPTGAKAQLDYILINNKWINSCQNCEPYNTFDSVYSDHRIVVAKICLSLRSNKPKSNSGPRYIWSSLRNNDDVRTKFIITLNNRFDALQHENDEISPNSTYQNFEIATKEAAEACVPLKPKVKRRVPWETKEVVEKRENLKKAVLLKNSNPTQTNERKFKAAQTTLSETYEAEQIAYLQEKVDQIVNASVNKQAATAWQIVNEISGRKTTNKAKLKASSQQERIAQWKNHFQNLLGNPPDITNEPIKRIVVNELNIQKGNFTAKELDIVLQKLQNGKSPGLDNIPAEVWKTREFDEHLLTMCNSVYHQHPIDQWTKGCILPFPKKGNLSNVENYRGITLTAIAAKIYNLLLLNRLRPNIEMVLRCNQNGFRQNRSTTGQILTVRRIIEEVKAKNLQAVLLFVDFSKAFDSIHRGKMEEILLAYGIPKETVTAIMMLYKNTQSMVRSPDGDTSFFDVTAGVLQGDTLAPYLFVICLDYVLRTSMDNNRELGFTMEKQRSRRYPAKTITDVDYADDLALLSDTISEATVLLHHLEKAAKGVGLYVNIKKTEFMSYNQQGNIKSLAGKEIKYVEEFTYLGSNIASSQKDIDIRIGKAWGAIEGLRTVWKSTLPTNLKRYFFRAAVETVLIYGSTTWTLTKQLENKLNGTYTRMLRVCLNMPWNQHPTKEQLYGHLSPVTESIREQRLRFAGHCHRSKEELAGKTILWRPKHGYVKPGRPARTYLDQLTEDTGCLLEELPSVMQDRDGWKTVVKRVRVSSTR